MIGTEMCNWERALELLIDSGSIGVYRYCQVNQIVLHDMLSNVAWNYFTNVHFSSGYIDKMESTLLVPPVSLNKHLKLYVSQYSMKMSAFKECVRSALSTGVWNYTDSKINAGDQIDGAFQTPVKYVAENDPTGCLYNNVIPLESALYGSNFSGNYYIFEIFARGDQLKKLLSATEVKRIQEVLHRCKLNYRLDQLTDRIGNVVCKFEIETLKVTPKRLGAYGMVYSYELSPYIKHSVNLHFHVEQEHDRLLYTYTDEDVCLEPGESIEKGVDANQCRTTMTITDLKTDLVLFRASADQSLYSGYRGQITPGTIVASPTREYRTVMLDKVEYHIPMSGVSMAGRLEYLVEMTGAGERQQDWEYAFFKKQKFFNVYTSGEHEQAILDIRSIINGRLLWDLQEIKIIDPYLAPKDILNTAAFCEKQGIRVRCITNLHTISRNRDAKADVLSKECDSDEYNKILKSFRKQLEDGLGTNTDLRLSFRTVHGNSGCSFHDRYLILKFKINKTRVWSLGTSINSVGRSHHIIQIVEVPTLIDAFFDDIWEQTEKRECIIYDYMNDDALGKMHEMCP